MLILARSTDLRTNHECGCLLVAFQMNHSSATPCLYSDVLLSVWLPKSLLSSCEYPQPNRDLDLFPCVATNAFSVLAHLLRAPMSGEPHTDLPLGLTGNTNLLQWLKKTELLSLVTNTPSYLLSQVHVVFIKVIFLKKVKANKISQAHLQFNGGSEVKRKAHNIELASMQKLDTHSKAEGF